MIAQWYRRLVLEPVAFIEDFQGQPEPGPRSATFKAVVIGVSAPVLLTLMNFIVLNGDLQRWVSSSLLDLIDRMPYGEPRDSLLVVAPLFRHISWSLGCVFFYFVLPALIVRFVFRERIRDYGLSLKGLARHLPVYLLLFMPVLVAVIIVSYTPAFQKTYPFYHHPRGMADFWTWEFFYGLQFFALEFFFRGFILHGTKRRMGIMSVFLMVIPYCMIHFQKPFAEALGAIIAGTVLGILSLRTGNIWGGVFIHCAVAVAMDLASLIQRGALPPW
jgi:membrane protease YdiL (CAAX protease family)